MPSRANNVIDLSGNPEVSASDGRGSIYVNVKNKSEPVRIDSKTLKCQGALAAVAVQGTERIVDGP